MDSRLPALAVEAHGLCRRYGRRWALVDLGFALPRGKALMVAGRNGSGKTTLLRLVGTAIAPDRGTLRVFGRDARQERASVRRDVALLGHSSYLYEALSALQNLEIVARFLGQDARRAALLPRLDEVALAERADDAVQTFSAGMRKRLALARTLLQDAELILLDEPYGELDPPGFALMDRVIEDARARGKTLLMATHLLEHGAGLCDDGIVLEQGRLAWSGRAAELPSQAGLRAGGTA
jgi:heme exporter protein A